ncbi:MAG: hypothetical protein M1838_000653 [Thelocarpon superellum]|nr:MAG: hypothetical protein M1838_000653 [Thelocarpon superellum]
MGALCGKESDPFAQPGRTLDSAPAPASGRSPVPSSATQSNQINGGSRTLGGRSNAADAREAAARAAEERARGNQPKGKLANQLASQKQQKRTDTLGQASKEERRFRDADAATQARNWE